MTVLVFTVSLLLIVTAFFSPSIATDLPSDIIVATEEMQRANYFTFVMLINMAPSDLITGNITFLMPNDRILSRTHIAESSVVDFLLRHSIPSPLLIDHLVHFPTGSMIPTSRPGFMLKVTNEGRRRFFLSNVRISSANICTKGSAIRCHGIDGVVQPTMVPQPNIPPNCLSNTSTPVGPTPLPAPTPPSPVPLAGDIIRVPATAPPPKSSSPGKWDAGLGNLAMTCFMLLVVKVCLFIY